MTLKCLLFNAVLRPSKWILICFTDLVEMVWHKNDIVWIFLCVKSVGIFFLTNQCVVNHVSTLKLPNVLSLKIAFQLKFVSLYTSYMIISRRHKFQVVTLLTFWCQDWIDSFVWYIHDKYEFFFFFFFFIIYHLFIILMSNLQDFSHGWSLLRILLVASDIHMKDIT